MSPKDKPKRRPLLNEPLFAFPSLFKDETFRIELEPFLQNSANFLAAVGHPLASGEIDLHFRGQLSNIFVQYWLLAGGYKNFDEAKDRSQIEKVSEACEKFLAVMHGLPKLSAYTIRMTARTGASLAQAEAIDPISHAIVAAEDLAMICDILSRTPHQTGRRTNHPVNNLVKALVRFWTELTGSSFVKTLEMADNGSTLVGRQNEFVCGLARLVDPSITDQQVRTALKAIPPTRKSKNSGSN